MMGDTSSPNTLQTLCFDERFEKLVQTHKSLVAPTPEENYWAAFGYMVTGHAAESEALFEQALISGYRPAAAFMASFAHAAKQYQRAEELLALLGSFENLEPWHRGIAYREKGKLLEDSGNFTKAQEAYRTSWEILSQLPHARILLGFAGYLLGWTLELFNQSQKTLEVVREAKKYALANRRVQLIQLQISAAAQLQEFDEAYSALAELETFVPNDPHLQGLASNAAGQIARFEGRWLEGLNCFENAIIASSGAHTEAAFGSCLAASHCSLALGDKAGALSYLNRAEGEFFSIDPFLAPAYSARAQANLALRRGALDAAMGKATAIDHLQNARQIFESLGLPLGQCLALLHLAGWYENERNRKQALELLKQSEVLRAEFQDIGSYEAELVLLPQLKPLLGWLQQSSAPKERKNPSEAKRTLAQDLRRLVISESFDEAKLLFEYAQTGQAQFGQAQFGQAQKPNAAARCWAGLAELFMNKGDEAIQTWTVGYGNPLEPGFAGLRALAHWEMRDANYPVQLRTAHGRTDAFRLDEEGQRQRLTFKNAQTARLLALLADRHTGDRNGGLKLEEILRVLFEGMDKELAVEAFEACSAEIDALGKKMPSNLPQFAVRTEAKTNRVQLVNLRTGDGTYGALGQREIATLPILSISLDAAVLEPAVFETGAHAIAGQTDTEYALAEAAFAEAFFCFIVSPKTPWLKDNMISPGQRSKMEMELLEDGLAWIERLEDEGESGAALLLAKNLSSLEGRDLLCSVSAAKTSILKIAARLKAESHIKPGQLKVSARVKLDSRTLDKLEREMNNRGWRMRRLTSAWQKQLSDAAKFDAELDAILDGEQPVEEVFELICTRFFPETEIKAESERTAELLAQHKAFEVKFSFRS